MRKLFSLFAAVVLSMTCVFAQDGWTWTESDIYPSLNTPFSEVINVGSIQFIGKVSRQGSPLAELIISNNGSVVATRYVFLIPDGDNVSYTDDQNDNASFGYHINNLKGSLSNVEPGDVVDGYTYTLHIPAGRLQNSRGQLNGDMSFTYHQYTPTNTTMNYRFANDWQGEETLTQGVFAFDAGENAFVATDAAGSHLNKPVSLLEVGFDDANISHVEYIYVDHFYNRSISGSFEKENGKFVSRIHPALRFDATTQADYQRLTGMTAYELTINAWTGTYVPGSLPTYHNVFSPNAEDTNFDLYIHVQSDELEGWHGKLVWGSISTSVIDNGGRDSAYLYNAIADLCVVYKETFELDKADPWAAIDAHHPLVKDDQLAWLNDCVDVEVVENGMTSFDMNLDRTTWSIAGMGYGWSFPFIFFDNDCLEPGTHWHVYVLKTPRYGMDINLTDADFVACGVIGHGVKEQNHDGMHSHIHDGISHANPQEPTDYYTTFYDGLHTTIITSANTTAYAAKIGQDAEGTFVTLNAIEGNIIPQGVAVLLKGEGNEVVVEHYFDEVPAVTVPDNDLQGVDFTTAVSALSAGTYYTLAAEDNIMAFYHYTGANMNPNKAYLQIPAGAPAPRRITFGTNTATGMENAAAIKAEKILRDGQLLILKNGHLYNVQGALVK